MSITSGTLLLLEQSSIVPRVAHACAAEKEDSAKGAVMSPIPDQSSGHGKPAVTIFVNTREFGWDDKEISYEQVYELAYPNEPLADGDVVRVEYSRGHNGGGAGALQLGQSVKVKPNMVFDVYATSRS